MASVLKNVIIKLNFSKLWYSQSRTIRNVAIRGDHETSKVQNKSEDILLQNLKSVVSTKSLLETVGTHSRIMNNEHILQALRSLFQLQKSKTSQMVNPMHHPQFQKLCAVLHKRSTELEINDIIESLKVLTFIGVPLNSKISQILLQLIRTQINDLSLQHIIFLQFLLTQSCRKDPPPLVEALRIALPLVLDINLKTKIDMQNTSQLCDLLQFAAKNQISSTRLIVDALYGAQLHVQNAKSIVWSLCDLSPSLKYANLLDKCFEILSVDIHKLELPEIDTITTKLVQQISKQTMYYYNERLFDSIALTLLDRQVDLSSAIGALRRFSQIDHVNLPLIDYATSLFLMEETSILSADPAIVRIYVSVIAKADYINMKRLNEIKELLLESNFVKNNSKVYGIGIAVEMAVIGCFSRQVLESALNSEYLLRITKSGSYSQNSGLLTLTQAIKYMSPENSDLIPNDQIIDEALGNIENRCADFSLKGALSTALGGTNYFKTNIDATLGYVIDHVIVMRKGGYPIALNSELEAEDITPTSIDEVEKMAQDNQIIAVMVFPSTSYALNADKLKGTYALMVRVLEARGITVLPIALFKWHELLDHEKIPYLMQKIRQCTEKTDADKLNL